MSGCNNISSNCVVWQGPDIECLGLCSGATVTQVVYELATLYCNFLESIKVSNFDLKCLPTQCPPETFKDLVQLIIDTLCQIQVTNGENGTNGNYTQVEAFAPGENGCAEGGVAIRTFDGATNTQLSEYFICNAVDGNDGLPGVKGDRGDYVQVSAATIGQCPTGGSVITLLDGTDDSVISTSIICNGANGADGNDGIDGINGVDGNDGVNGNYVETTPEPAGVNCPAGGVRIDVKSGIDNTVLTTEYVCNEVYDSGWKTLPVYTVGLGYGFANTYNLLKIRVIDRTVYLNGNVVFPIADGANNLQTIASINFNTYVNVYTGTDGGYNTLPEGILRSAQPILPNVLRPEIATSTDNGISFFKRVIFLNPGTTEKVNMQAPFLYGVNIGTDGKLRMYNIKYIESENVTTDYPFSDLRQVTSRFDSGDGAIDFSNYKNSYTGAVLQQNLSELAGGYTYGVTFDPSNALHYGGFTTYVNTSFLISNAVSIADIKAAFDAIP